MFCKKKHRVVFGSTWQLGLPAPTSFPFEAAQNGSGVVESSELADLLMNLNIEPMSHVLDEARRSGRDFSAFLKVVDEES